MQKETVTKTQNTSPLHALRVARQVRAIKRAILHNVDHGVIDMPAQGLITLPFSKPSLAPGALDKLNKTLDDYDVRVDTYKMKVRDSFVDRIVVTHLDNALVEPSPAYQSALQARHFSAHPA